MPVQFRDYYETLGVSKTATATTSARPSASWPASTIPTWPRTRRPPRRKFKQINEAYEILSDKDKREKYDQLGADWQQYGTGAGPARPGRGAGAGAGGGRRRAGAGGGTGGVEFDFGGTGYSDFFEQFFGNGRGRPQPGGGGFDFFGAGQQQAAPERGADVEADFSVTLEEALNGSKKSVTLRRTDAAGNVKTETYDVKVPAGVHEGQRIRLRSRGEAGPGGGAAGDLFLRVRLAAHPDFRVEAGGDLYYDLTVAPWQAVLGTEVNVPTLGRQRRETQDSGGFAGGQALPAARAWAARDGRRADGPVRAGRRDAARATQRAGAGAVGAVGAGVGRR